MKARYHLQLTSGRAGGSKYKNNKVTYNGEVFDSKKEFEYYLTLKDREKWGEIKHLRRQVEIIIQPSFVTPEGKKERAIKYVADFVFVDAKTMQERVIDVKGYRTEVYKLKKKLLAFRGIYIEEV